MNSFKETIEDFVMGGSVMWALLQTHGQQVVIWVLTVIFAVYKIISQIQDKKNKELQSKSIRLDNENKAYEKELNIKKLAAYDSFLASFGDKKITLSDLDELVKKQGTNETIL